MLHAPPHRTVVAVVTAVLAVGFLQGCTGRSPIFGGCTDRDRRLAGILAEQPVLDSHPGRTQQFHDYQGCDTDDGFAFAGRRYHSLLERERVLAHYRRAAEDDGWEHVGDAPAPPTTGLVISGARSCHTKTVDGVTAHLGVSFPSDLGEGAPPGVQAPRDVYELHLTGSHDGGAWC